MRKRRSLDDAIDCNNFSDPDGIEVGSEGISECTTRESILLGGGCTRETGLGDRGT